MKIIKNKPEGYFSLFFCRRRREDPRVSAGDKPPLAVNFLQKQQKQRGCPSRRSARALMRLLETLRGTRMPDRRPTAETGT